MYILFALKCALSIFAIVGNIFIISAFWLDRHLRANEANIYLHSLAISDLICGAITMPGYAYAGLLDSPPDHLCKSLLFSATLIGTATTFHLIVMSVERYRKITKPLQQLRRRSLKRAWTKSALIWLQALIAATYCIFVSKGFENGCDFSTYHLNFSVLLPAFAITILPVLLCLVLNTLVYVKIRKRRICIEHRAHARIYSVNRNVVINHNTNELYIGNEKVSQILTNLLKEHKALIIIIFINIGYLSTWPTYGVAWILVTHNALFQIPADVLDCLRQFIWFAFANSILNPLILMIMHVKFRSAILKRLPGGVRLATRVGLSIECTDTGSRRSANPEL